MPEGGAQKTGHYKALNAQRLRECNNVVLSGFVGMVFHALIFRVAFIFMRQIGIEMIPAYSPEARGRSERAFRTHQERLVKELALAKVTNLEDANAYIRDIYLPAFTAVCI